MAERLCQVSPGDCSATIVARMSQTLSNIPIAGACCIATAHTVILSRAWCSGARDLRIVVIRGDWRRESQKVLVQLFVDNFPTARAGRIRCGVTTSVFPPRYPDQMLAIRHPRRRRYLPTASRMPTTVRAGHLGPAAGYQHTSRAVVQVGLVALAAGSG
jgi:hypothetical protein